MMDRSTLFSFRSKLVALRVLSLLTMFSVGVAATSPARADSPRLQFDVSTTVACRDVTSPEFSATNPDERCMEARFQISLLSQLGPDRAAAELLIRIESPDAHVQIADYFRKTTLASEFAGPISVEQHEERAKSIDFKLGGQSPAVQAGGSASEQFKTTLHTQGQRLPPMELCAASGTVQRGHGVYFKLKPTSHTSLEGAHEYVLVLRVPASWRGDTLLVNCEAFGLETKFPSPTVTRNRWGARSFTVALYREGDAVAQARATQLVRAERELRTVVASQRRQLEKRTRPNPLQEIESLFKHNDPKLPENWLEQILYAAADLSPVLQENLPTKVRVAALNYRDAKRQIQRLGESDGPHVVAKPVIGPTFAPAVGSNASQNNSSRAENSPSRFDRLPPVE